MYILAGLESLTALCRGTDVGRSGEGKSKALTGVTER
jgi:hypothetical protein